jgi:hypothetical protein
MSLQYEAQDARRAAYVAKNADKEMGTEFWWRHLLENFLCKDLEVNEKADPKASVLRARDGGN